MITALILGLAGSLHCIGMCGPIALALPLESSEKWQLAMRLAIYHTGRIFTYGILGLFFGLAGKGLAVAGLQQSLSIAAGVFMLLMAFFAWRFEQLLLVFPGFGSLSQWVKRRMGVLINQNSRGAMLSLGALNGLLPCGMVYAALAGAISTGGLWQGGAFMVLFGLGTVPLFFMFTLAGNSLGRGLRQRFKTLQPLLLSLAGVWLISRGLHLDLSLFESAVPPADLDCH